MPQKKIAIIDNSINHHVYYPINHWMTFLENEWVPFLARERQFPDLDDGYTHLILTGSEASIVKRDSWVPEEIDLIQEASEKEIPVLGSCWGHQLLAVALLGPAHVRRCPNPEFGWIEIEITEDDSLLGVKGKAFSFSSHYEEVVDLPDSFAVFASTKNCPVQAFQVKEKPIWGIQFHPEIDIPSGRELLINFMDKVAGERPLLERALSSEPRDSGLIHHVVKAFTGTFP